MNTENAKQMYDTYLNAIEAYYSGKPVMSDEAFDAIENTLLQQGVIANKIRFEAPNTVECKHVLDGLEAKVVSLAAIHTKSNFTDELYAHCFSRIAQTCVALMLKYDGMSCASYYKDGLLQHVLTKGDGLSGYDVTQKFLKNGKVPLRLTQALTCQIRFEACVPKNRFAELSALGYSNERNAASGIVKAKNFDFIEYIDPIAYIVTRNINGKLYRAASTAMLKSIGWPTQYIADMLPLISDEHTIARHKFIEECNRIAAQRSELPYRIDGIVMRDYDCVQAWQEVMHNGYDYTDMLALKLDAESATSVVTGIDWRQRMNGELFPRVLFEPIELDGSTVKAASGFNWGFLRDNKIYPGSIIRIEKGGDIIPDIQECIQPGPVKDGTTDATLYQWPAHAYEAGVHLMLPEEFARSKRFLNGVMCLSIDGLGWSMANRILEGILAYADWTGITLTWPDMPAFQDLFRLVNHAANANELAVNLSFDFSKKSDRQVMEGLYERCHSIWASHFLKCLMIPGLGGTACEQVANKLAGLPYDFSGLNMQPIVNTLEHQLGCYNEFVGKSIVDAKTVQEILQAQKSSEQSATSFDKTVYLVMTGSTKTAGFKSKSEFLQALAKLHTNIQFKDAGSNFDNADGETVLVCGDADSNSKKAQATRTAGCKIMTYADAIEYTW